MNRHRTDAISLTFGVAFAALGVLLAALEDLDPRVIPAVVATAAGVTLLATAIGRGREPADVPDHPAQPEANTD